MGRESIETKRAGSSKTVGRDPKTGRGRDLILVLPSRGSVGSPTGGGRDPQVHLGLGVILRSGVATPETAWEPTR